MVHKIYRPPIASHAKNPAAMTAFPLRTGSPRRIAGLLAMSIAATLIGATATSTAARESPASPHRIDLALAHSDSAAVAATVASFHNALAAGDSVRALAMLDSAVVILESGDEERLADYRAHHLAADVEFARAVRQAPTPIRVKLRGDAAWASSTNTATGTFRGRPINSAGAELMVLTRAGDGWRIVAIHWSSHSRRSS